MNLQEEYVHTQREVKMLSKQYNCAVSSRLSNLLCQEILDELFVKMEDATLILKKIIVHNTSVLEKHKVKDVESTTPVVSIQKRLDRVYKQVASGDV